MYNPGFVIFDLNLNMIFLEVVKKKEFLSHLLKNLESNYLLNYVFEFLYSQSYNMIFNISTFLELELDARFKNIDIFKKNSNIYSLASRGAAQSACSLLPFCFLVWVGITNCG